MNRRTALKGPGTQRLTTAGPGPLPLSRERIRPNLEVHDLALRALAALGMPDVVGAVVGPEPAALPSGVRIVDPALE